MDKYQREGDGLKDVKLCLQVLKLLCLSLTPVL
jgi:hypothetical protein